MRLILIRHGDPNYEKDCLTEKGKREAALLAERTKGWQVDDVFVSPHGRARETAAPSLRNWKKNETMLEWVREFVVDGRIVWDYLPAEWTQDDANFCENQWTARPRTAFAQEEYKKVCRKADELLLSYGYERQGRLYRVNAHSDKTAVIFCHFGVSMILLSHLLNLPAQALLHGLFTAPTAITVLNTEERGEGVAYFRAERIGDTAHLYRGGEPISPSGYFTEVMQEIQK